jgi:hypothetical protein
MFHTDALKTLVLVVDCPEYATKTTVAYFETFQAMISFLVPFPRYGCWIVEMNSALNLVSNEVIAEFHEYIFEAVCFLPLGSFLKKTSRYYSSIRRPIY